MCVSTTPANKHNFLTPHYNVILALHFAARVHASVQDMPHACLATLWFKYAFKWLLFFVQDNVLTSRSSLYVVVQICMNNCCASSSISQSHAALTRPNSKEGGNIGRLSLEQLIKTNRVTQRVIPGKSFRT